MSKILKSSFLASEIAAFGMLMLLFFLNTNKPYLLSIPIIGIFGSYALLKKILNKRKSILFIISVSILLGVLISFVVIGLLYLL